MGVCPKKQAKNTTKCRKGISDTLLFEVNHMIAGMFNTVSGGIPRFTPYITEDMDIRLVRFDCAAAPDTLHLLKEAGCDAMIYYSPRKEDDAFFRQIAECGVKYLCTSSTGYDHFNLEAMRKYGLKGANVPAYSPNAISEYTVMVVLSLLRHLRKQILYVENGNYREDGIFGRELRNMEIGIVGAGRIGYTTMQCLSGFHPKKIYAYDPYPNDKVREYAQFVSLPELYEKSDIIIYHATYSKANHHMVNREAIAAMKDGVVLVNAARGGLFDAQAVLEGVESGKIGAVGLDVIEGEDVLTKKARHEECPLPVLGALLKHSNVIFTPHIAYYTDEADRNLAEGTIRNLDEYRTKGFCSNEVVQK